jgi:hypothetical protein
MSLGWGDGAWGSNGWGGTLDATGVAATGAVGSVTSAAQLLSQALALWAQLGMLLSQSLFPSRGM